MTRSERVVVAHADALVAEHSNAKGAVAAALAFRTCDVVHNDGLTGGAHTRVRVDRVIGEVVVADNTVHRWLAVLQARLDYERRNERSRAQAELGLD